jgi:hypothetical protein
MSIQMARSQNKDHIHYLAQYFQHNMLQEDLMVVALDKPQVEYMVPQEDKLIVVPNKYKVGLDNFSN